MLKYGTYLNETKDIFSYQIVYKETSLFIRSPKDYKNRVLRTLISLRKPLENYIKENPDFLTSLSPLKPKKNAPKIVKKMCEVSQKTKIGPMSAVAGTIAEFLGYEILKWLKKENLKEFLIIENGGDIFAYVNEPITVGIYAGENSLFTGKIGIRISLLNQPLGICTSSGTLGHSLSFGKADAVVIVSNSASFSDTLATATCNLLKTQQDILKVIEFAKKFEELLFVCIIIGKNISFWSKVENIEVVKI